jgi:hypothetical protein
MNEDLSFNKNSKKEKESGFAPDFCDSLGKGMLSAEKIETLKDSSGLTPLRPGNDIRKNISKNFEDEVFPARESTDTLTNSSGLTPLHSGSEIFKRRVFK